LIKLNDVFLHDPFPTLLHIIFVIPMTVNDVNLYVSFREVSGLISLRKKGDEISLREEVVFSFVKTLLKRIFAGCSIHRVRKCLISVGYTISRLRSFRKMHYI
jgi:hypothetical protein